MDIVKHLDRLVAEFVLVTNKSITKVTLLEFLKWVGDQTSNSKEKKI